MQKFRYEGAMSPVEVKVVYQSKYYTVARASVKVKKNGDGAEKEVYAEGIARRSYLDKDAAVGLAIATGRAKKALAIKLSGEHVHIHKAKDLFMNC